ncbi:Rcs stress response system protein RcsF [Shewanella sp. Isolate11]|uniref:Rcs stress response system protein RcsF n=1 Tax=Shewanella sp. Isolate11 TaxID=2908530 RepID=UPI001EFD41AD|nr:Rcs stress response system protein RcsF [Shewanella sp. Isolate11]MCG9696168.1 hypothetical protein [Shewanella sp. Isolate11]
MKKTIFIISTLLLSGCAGDYAFHSNLDGEAIDNYFKVGDVVVYQNNQHPTGAYELKSLVEGESCQEKPNDVPASIADARTNARRAAAELGANGLIIKSCVLFEEATNACITNAICIGQAILTPEAKAE